MKFYFLSNVLKCIALYFLSLLWDSAFFLTQSEVPFSLREQDFFLFGGECWRSGAGGSLDHFTMFAVRASFCAFTSAWAGASSVCSVAQPHPERHDQATTVNSHSLHCELRLIIFFCEHRVPTLGAHKALVIERHKQTSTLAVKLLRALWLQLSTLYLSRVRPEPLFLFEFMDYFS